MGSGSAGVGTRTTIGKIKMKADGGQGAAKMDETSIIGVVRGYLEDRENSYALMLTGEWGCGKTYFVKHALTENLEAGESRHPVVVASAYGVKDLAELCGAIEAGFISKCAIGRAGSGEKSRKDSLVEFAKDTGVSFLGKKIRELEKKAGVDLKMAPLNAVNLIIGPEALLVIDDVERCDMGLRELLGAVDHLVVGCGKKVILVCNEDEWRKRIEPKDGKGQDARGTAKEYENLIEKTVWRKCRFEPSVDSVVERVLGDVLRDVYPEAIEDAASAIRESGSPNFRSLGKMRPVLVGMVKSGFFAEPADPESARAVFREACGFAAGAAKGKRIEPPSSREDSVLRGGIFESRRLKYAALDFISCFFERCEGVDPEHVRFCLDDYLATFHPDGPAAREALRCIEKIRDVAFRDAEIPGLVEAIVAGIAPEDGSRGLSFDVYPDALRAVNGIADDFAAALPGGTAPLIEAMESSIGRDPESAVKSIRKNRVEWQEVPFDSNGTYEIPALEEVDRLRELVLATLRERESKSLGNVLKNAPDQFAEKLYLAFSKSDDRSEPILSLISLDASLFMRAMEKMPPRDIQLVHRVLSPNDLMESRPASLEDEDKKTLAAWATRLGLEISKVEAKEYYQRVYFDAIHRSLDELANL